MTDENIINLILDEMSVYDKKTGLNAADIPISLITSPVIMGQYSHSVPEFRFNRLLFNETEPIIVESGLISMIIKHEYAHYICNTLYNQKSHGGWFYECGKIIGYEPDEREYGIIRDLATRKWNKLNEIEVDNFILDVLPQTIKQDSLCLACYESKLKTMLDLFARDDEDLKNILFKYKVISKSTVLLFIKMLDIFKINYSKVIAA